MQVTLEKCECGASIRPDPPGQSDIATWVCACRRFGYLLPPEYLREHPEEFAVQVCGRKRRSETAPVAA